MRNGESIVYNTIDIRLELLSESKSTEDTLTSTSTEEDKEPKEPEPKFEFVFAKLLSKKIKTNMVVFMIKLTLK